MNGFKAAVPSANNALLKSRFAKGGRISDINLERTCIDWSWEEQEKKLAGIILTNAFAIYEGWLTMTLGQLKLSSKKMSKAEKGLQRPTTWKGEAGRTPSEGFRYALSTVGEHRWPLSSQLHSGFKKHRKYPKSDIEDLLTCLRFFKEVRNCLMHSGGIANARLERAEADYRSCSDRLNLKEVPKYEPVMSGKKVTLSLRGVVGLTDVLKQIIIFTDAELIFIKGAEDVVIGQLKAAVGSDKRKVSKDTTRACSAAKSIFRKAHLALDGSGESALKFLVAHSIVDSD